MHLSRNGKLGVVAVVAVALAAGGAAYASTKLHSSSSSASSRGPGFFNGQRPSGSANGYGFPGGGPGNGTRGPRGGLGFGGGLEAAASYLGLSTSELFQDLRSGKTLAQLANATDGKSATGLIAAMVAAEQKQLDQAVSAGTITQSQADQLSANIKSRVTAMVNGQGFGGRGGGFGGPPGGGNGFGPGQRGGGQTPSQGSSSSGTTQT